MDWSIISASYDAEEKRLEQAASIMPHLFNGWNLPPGLKADPGAAGLELWHDASTGGELPDDRLLYWRRLACRNALRESGADDQAIADLERSSRGMTELPFSSSSAARVLITGFDPFRLDDHIDQTNPSGCFALRYAVKALELKGRRVDIRTCIVPVRYPDFDAGLIEDLMAQVTSGSAPDLILTISMGRTGFDLERYPGRRRSAEGPDNLGLMSGGSPEDPAVPKLGNDLIEGPEFVEFSLPADAMLAANGPFKISDNREVTTLEGGTFRTEELSSLMGQVSVRGSGGGYLSNEISYRAINWLNQHRHKIPIGHIHTPRIAGQDTAMLGSMVAQLDQVVQAAVEAVLP